MRFTFFLASGLLLFCHPSKAQFNVEPYLQDGAPHAMRVMWESASTGPATLEWGTDENLGNTVTSAGVESLGGAMHDVLIDGLAPNTPYYYRVASGAVSTLTYRFKTPPLPEAEADFSFVAMSDMQKSGADPDVFDHIVHQGVLDYFGGETSEEIALVLIPGDLVVNGNAYEQWSNDFLCPLTRSLCASPPLSRFGQPRGQLHLLFPVFPLARKRQCRLRRTLVVQGLTATFGSWDSTPIRLTMGRPIGLAFGRARSHLHLGTHRFCLCRIAPSPQK